MGQSFQVAKEALPLAQELAATQGAAMIFGGWTPRCGIKLYSKSWGLKTILLRS